MNADLLAKTRGLRITESTVPSEGQVRPAPNSRLLFLLRASHHLVKYPIFHHVCATQRLCHDDAQHCPWLIFGRDLYVSKPYTLIL